MEPQRIQKLVQPMLRQPLPEAAYGRLAAYLELLFRWNARINLTAVRDAEILARLHLGECLRCAQGIPAGAQTVLDFGSGAGLPGIPIAIARPELRVSLAESQGKKAAFLREAVRVLELPHAAVLAGRVEAFLPGQVYDLVVLRAVDDMATALRAAAHRMAPGGACCVLTTEAERTRVELALPQLEWKQERVPGTQQRVMLWGSANPNCFT